MLLDKNKSNFLAKFPYLFFSKIDRINYKKIKYKLKIKITKKKLDF